MNKIIFIVVLAVGVVLIINGVHASDSVSSDFSTAHRRIEPCG